MNILLDNTPFDSTLSPAATIEELLDSIKPRLLPEDRMIVSLTIDDQVVPEEQIDEVLTRPLSSCKQLDVATASRRGVATQALAAAAEILTATKNKQERVVTLLAEDGVPAALLLLGECIAEWGQAHRCVVQVVRLMEIDLTSLGDEQFDPIEVLQGVAHNLSEIRSCLGHRDYVLLNDVLQYEMLPTFDRWERLLDLLMASVMAPRSAENVP
jgi:hypothetical protein